MKIAKVAYQNYLISCGYF